MTGTSLIATMAAQQGMDPVQFARTIRKTVLPSDHTEEQFAAFMLVAHKYGLDPITREIYAYPARKGGGINPVVSLDGWVNLVNSHPQSDGFEISFVEGKGDKPYSATCTMWRKDKSHPTIVTEYYSECYRNTDPWNQMAYRMLRHKAFKEAARLAFGFAGIADEDEAKDMMDRFQRVVGEEKKKLRLLNPQDRALADWAAEEPETVVDADGTIVDEPLVNEGGSSESPQAPPPPAAAAPSRQEAIDKILQLATDQALTVQQRLENLEDVRPVYEDLHGQPFAKDLIQIGSRVAKGELKPDRAKAFLETLP